MKPHWRKYMALHDMYYGVFGMLPRRSGEREPVLRQSHIRTVTCYLVRRGPWAAKLAAGRWGAGHMRSPPRVSDA